MSISRDLARVLAGRWQIPLALAAVAAMAITLVRVRPNPRRMNFDAVMGDIGALTDSGQFVAASDAAATLLEVTPPLPAEQRAVLHDQLARTLYAQEAARPEPNLRNVRRIIEHLGESAELGVAESASRTFQQARAREWLGEPERAIGRYREVLHLKASPRELRATHQALVALLEHRPLDEEQRQRSLLALLEDEGVSPGYVWWALQRAMLDALDAEDVARASELLNRHGQRLKNADLRGYHDYLQAWIAVVDRRFGDAEALLGWIDDWLAEHDGNLDLPADFGYLPALAGWLRGEIELGEHRPQSALREFEAAGRLQPSGWAYVASAIGRGKALSKLERDDAALKVYQEVVEKVGPAAGAPGSTQSQRTRRLGVRVAPRLRGGVLDLAEQRQRAGRLKEAIGYLSLALDLTPADQPDERFPLAERLGNMNLGAAEASQDPSEAYALYLEAARRFEQAASLAGMDQDRLAGMLWSAAEQYDRAGRTGDARRMLERFVRGRGFDPRYPEALLRLGQLHEVVNDLTEAVKWYRQVADGFPKLPEAARARLRIADALIAMGEREHAEAEKMLAALLEGDDIMPDSRVFQEALRSLCDLLYYHERHAEAISRLEDFEAFRPDDPRRTRMRFMLSDSYRKSAIELRDNPPPDADRARARDLSRERFRRAEQLFAGLLEAIGQEQERDDSSDVYRRLAMQYRADCLLALNEPQTLADALGLYRQIAAQYDREPAALVAQTQIANIYLRSGKIIEAARAIERAHWLLDNISDKTFEDLDDGMGRAHWRRYLTTVADSELFKNVFAAVP